jgi:hypothetical protein
MGYTTDLNQAEVGIIMYTLEVNSGLVEHLEIKEVKMAIRSLPIMAKVVRVLAVLMDLLPTDVLRAFLVLTMTAKVLAKLS